VCMGTPSPLTSEYARCAALFQTHRISVLKKSVIDHGRGEPAVVDFLLLCAFNRKGPTAILFAGQLYFIHGNHRREPGEICLLIWRPR
jgi:hypothetical protein